MIGLEFEHSRPKPNPFLGLFIFIYYDIWNILTNKPK